MAVRSGPRGVCRYEPDDEAPFWIVDAVAVRADFRSIESVNLVKALQDRPSMMKRVPRFLRGPHRMAMRLRTRKMLASA